MRVLMAGAMIAGLCAIGWAGAMASGFAEPMPPHFAMATMVLGLLLLAVGVALLLPLKPALSLPATLRAMVLGAAVFAWLLGVWAIQYQPSDVHDTAKTLRQVAGERHLVFYGEPSLSLVFQLGQTIPSVGRKSPLPRSADDGTAIVVESDPSDAPANLPEPWHLAWRGGPEGHHFQLWLAGAAGDASK